MGAVRAVPEKLLVVAMTFLLSVVSTHALADEEFQRGDCNGDGARNLVDVVFLLGFLFLEGDTPTCLDACDATDDGALLINDAVFLLGHVFIPGSPSPPPPFPACGPDPTQDALHCQDGGVVCAPQQAPVIVSTPAPRATVQVAYTYDVDAIDPDAGDALIYSVTTGPLGVSIDPTTGQLSWTPAAADVGTQGVIVRATDAAGLYVEQAFAVEVGYRVNCGEGTVVFTDATGNDWSVDQGFDPLQTSTFGVATSVDIGNTSDDAIYRKQRFVTGAESSYVLSMPTGIYTVNLHFAELFYTTQVGARVFDVTLEEVPVVQALDLVQSTGVGLRAYMLSFTVFVHDGALDIGLVAQQDAPVLNGIEVLPSLTGGSAPTIVSSPPVSGVQGVLYQYTLEAVDPDVGQQLVHSLTVAPPAASMDSDSGLILWVPGALDVGLAHAFTARVDDGSGLHSEQSWFVFVDPAPVNVAPTIVSSPPTSASVGTLVHYPLSVTDPNAGQVISFLLVQGPAGATMGAASGVLEWTATGSQLGTHSVVIRATDAGGLFDEQAFDLQVAYRINCGKLTATTVDSQGNLWAADFGFSGGGVYPTNGVPIGDPIANTVEDSLYQQVRFSASNLSYQLPVPVVPGGYAVRLHFAEIDAAIGVGQRTFSIDLEGVQQVSDYDIVLAAGGSFIATALEFPVSISDGVASIVIRPRPGFEIPIISALELYPEP